MAVSTTPSPAPLVFLKVPFSASTSLAAALTEIVTGELGERAWFANRLWQPPPGVGTTAPASLTTIDEYAFDGCTSLTTLTIVSDHAEPRVLTREQPFDTAAVQQALEQARAA